MNDLAALADDLANAAHAGAAVAGEGAVKAGALQAEVGFRLPGRAASVAVSGVGGMSARVGATQRRGVYQENAPAVAANISPDEIAGTMADVAAELGAQAVRG